jgi:hypothetical protein
MEDHGCERIHGAMQFDANCFAYLVFASSLALCRWRMKDCAGILSPDKSFARTAFLAEAWSTMDITLRATEREAARIH